MKYTLRGFNHATIGNFQDFPASGYPEKSVKYASRSFVGKHFSPEICGLVDKAPLVGNHKHVVIDIKVHDLEPSVVPALPNWHIDSVNHPCDDRREEVNHLICFGKCLTSFLANDLVVDIPESGYLTKFNNFCNGQEVAIIPPSRFITYGRLVHRASVSNVSERRLFIRVTETDIISPKNQWLKPTIVKVYNEYKKMEF